MTRPERDQLFLLAAPFQDGVDESGQPKMYFCRDCAMIEGVLLANPHWRDHVEVKRIAFPRPRAEIVALIGEANQSLPCLVLAREKGAPANATRAHGRAFLDDVTQILDHLAAAYGGAARHP